MHAAWCCASLVISNNKKWFWDNKWIHPNIYDKKNLLWSGPNLFLEKNPFQPGSFYPLGVTAEDKTLLAV